MHDKVNTVKDSNSQSCKQSKCTLTHTMRLRDRTIKSFLMCVKKKKTLETGTAYFVYFFICHLKLSIYILETTVRASQLNIHNT